MNLKMLVDDNNYFFQFMDQNIKIDEAWRTKSSYIRLLQSFGLFLDGVKEAIVVHLHAYFLNIGIEYMFLISLETNEINNVRCFIYYKCIKY